MKNKLRLLLYNNIVYLVIKVKNSYYSVLNFKNDWENYSTHFRYYLISKYDHFNHIVTNSVTNSIFTECNNTLIRFFSGDHSNICYVSPLRFNTESPFCTDITDDILNTETVKQKSESNCTVDESKLLKNEQSKQG
jgi:hypothetical protein